MNHFRDRQKKRNASEIPVDKVNNPLTSTTGAPGSGKSTLCAHFPKSTAYSNYINNTSPIVSTITFNSTIQ